MYKKWIILIYTVAVMLLIIVSEFIYTLRGSTRFNLLELFRPIVISQIIYMTVTLLLTRYMLYYYFLKKKYLQLSVAAILVFTIFVFLRYALEEIVFPELMNFRNYPQGTTLRYYTFDNLNYGIGYITLGFAFFFIEYQFDVQKKESELIQKSKEAELAFLRSQISPHFLFNSLNSIYSLSYKQSPKATQAIMQLSELVRFMLYEQKSLIPLSQEWSYVINYIALQEIRYSHLIKKSIETSGNLDAVEIPPFILIPLVENAFKHGDFSTMPLRISLDTNLKELRFAISNNISQNPNEVEGGIGLENIQRRLKLLYNGRHQLLVKEDGHTYTVQLEILL